MAEQPSLHQHAVDLAFIRHVGDLFDRFVAALKNEPNHNPDNSHALRDLKHNYDYAKLAHKEMSDYLASQ